MSAITTHSISNFDDALASFLTTNGVEGFKSTKNGTDIFLDIAVLLC